MLDTGVGYYYVYQPDHPLANKAGKVYIHRYVASVKIGRYVTSDEVVHHTDEVKTNNYPDNLEVMDIWEHAKHHAEGRKVPLEDVLCSVCKKEFSVRKIRIEKSNSGVYCSKYCFQLSTRKLKVTKEELSKLVWEYPASKLSKILGVSDVAIGKMCKKWGVEKPGRGYWRKLETGKI